MGLFDRHAGLLEAYRDVRTTGYDPFQIRMERVLSPTKAIINGRETLLVGTNNYFGLTFDPSCMEAAIEAIRAEGTGTTGSRIANGSYTEHVALEKEIAEFYGKKHCMVFTTGYQANLGIIATLAGQGDFLLIDADSHASIYDACKMTQAEVVRFKHNDPSSLEARLRRLGDKPGNRVVVLEGIYSMLGDSAPLREFVDVCKKYGAYVLIDEAHSLGALGEHGRGLCESTGVIDDCHFIVGTFSKTLGAIGGYCVSDDPDFDILRVTVRSYMFTASLPPSIVASVRQALRVVKARPELRTQLWNNVATLYDGLKAQGFTLGPEHGPVVGVHLPDRMTAIGFWRAMLDAGIYVNVAVPPATPNGVSLLRCSLCAVHTKEQLDHMVEVMTGIGRQFGVLPNQPRCAPPARASPGARPCSRSPICPIRICRCRRRAPVELLGKRATGYVNWWRRRAHLHVPAALAGIVADIRQQKPDHIALTGDLVNISLPTEFTRAAEWLKQLGGPQDVTVIPGNHDVYVATAWPKSLGLWGAYIAGDGQPPASDFDVFPTLRRRGPVALVGLSSGVPKPPLLRHRHAGPGADRQGGEAAGRSRPRRRLPRRADPSSAAHHREPLQAADRCRGVPGHDRAASAASSSCTATITGAKWRASPDRPGRSPSSASPRPRRRRTASTAGRAGTSFASSVKRRAGSSTSNCAPSARTARAANLTESCRSTVASRSPW